MIRLGCLLSIVMIAIGCGAGNGLPTAPVAGAVVYQGKPLSSGRIVFFHPSGQAQGADIAADGAFRLLAFQGENRVTVTLRERDLPTRRGKSFIPEHYAEPESSGLTFNVKPGEDNRAEFALKD